MCGITGIVGLEDKGLVEEMCKAIAHRGPDDQGVFSDKDVSIGNRRLSIIDLKKGKQPIHNKEGDKWIVYNGEVYNHEELRERMKGHEFYTDSDTEAVLHAYEEWGESFVNELNGMYAFCIWDSKEKKAVLARDKLGIKPLYYSVDGDVLVFGSEIKCILEYGIGRELDFQAMACYLRYGSVFGERTLFKNVKKVLPGEMLVWENGKLEKKRFWKPEMSIEVGNESEASERIREIFGESVEKRLMSDVPFGAFLSGGVDSSAVVGLMSRHVNEVKTFSVGFGEHDDELEYAKIASEHFGTDHRELMVDENRVPKVVDELVWHFDDLDGDAAAIPTYFVSELARKHVKVVLTGEGGDEVFAGYNRYKPFSEYFPFVPKWFKSGFFERVVSVFAEKEVEEIAKFDEGGQEKWVKKYFGKEGNAMNQALLFGMEEVLPNQLLMKVDKTSMANGLEARVPLLDVGIVDYGNRLEPGLKMKGLNGKYILKKAVRSLVPEEILKRKKHGFSVPMERWLGGELGGMADSAIEEMSKRKFFRNKEVKRMAAERNGRKNSLKLWHLLMLEKWLERFYDGG